MVVGLIAADPRDAAIEADAERRFGGTLQARQTRRAEPGPAVYILTAAQNNTHVHAALWRNLLAYAKRRKAKLLVSQFTYNKAQFGEKSIKPGTGQADDYAKLWYAPEIEPYAYNDRLAITRSLTFCGETNVLPTAVTPLSGFENYTGRASGIFPHTKQAMQSIAALQAAKFNYTTGACTLRNYVQKKAGLKAEHHHAYGALIVEVDIDGDWFVRQIRATEDGAFQDLDWRVRDGKVSRGHAVEAINWGDVHVEQCDPVVRATNWGAGGILDTLRPRTQFMHDTFDAYARNHHEMRNPHAMFTRWSQRRDSIEAELRRVAAFLADESSRSWCKTVVVDSNHDQALTRWLREAPALADPVNAEFYLQAQRMIYAALAAGRDDFNVFEAVLRAMGVKRAVRFLGTDESYVICRRSGGVECGMHGHLGANGARGNPRGFSRMGRRVNTGHTHSAGIIDDCYTAGTSSLLRMSYNRGPSSWSHSHIVTYPNGCRTIITLWRGKWRG
ncbi:MAG TPA: hypothetical protein VFM56_12650 [Solimonas sp.]|nr:hypothetical protein [Solimonas sp.]